MLGLIAATADWSCYESIFPSGSSQLLVTQGVLQHPGMETATSCTPPDACCKGSRTTSGDDVTARHHGQLASARPRSTKPLATVKDGVKTEFTSPATASHGRLEYSYDHCGRRIAGSHPRDQLMDRMYRVGGQAQHLTPPDWLSACCQHGRACQDRSRHQCPTRMASLSIRYIR